MSKSFDFIDFLDELQPHLDGLNTVCLAINGISDSNEINLPCLKTTLEYHIQKINSLCDQFLKKYRGK